MAEEFQSPCKQGGEGNPYPCPCPYKIKEERDKLDPVTGEVVLDKDSMPQTEEVERKIPVFRAVSVFDVNVKFFNVKFCNNLFGFCSFYKNNFTLWYHLM